MKIIMLPAALVFVLSFAGCTTTGFMGFLATNDMLEDKISGVDGRISGVDGKISDVDGKISDQEAKMDRELASIREEMGTYKDMMDRAQSALDEARATQKEVEDLKILMGELEGRLARMPRESILKLEQLLRDFLDREQPPADGQAPIEEPAPVPTPAR
jgi:DNA repair exonuclease SbcCD ATPase subunit